MCFGLLYPQYDLFQNFPPYCSYKSGLWAASRFAFVKSLRADILVSCVNSPALLCRWKINCVVISILYRGCSAAIFHPFNCQYIILKKILALCENPRKYIWDRLAMKTKSWHVVLNFHGVSCTGRPFHSDKRSLILVNGFLLFSIMQ